MHRVPWNFGLALALCCDTGSLEDTSNAPPDPQPVRSGKLAAYWAIAGG